MFSLIPMHFLSPDVTIQMRYSVVTVNENSNTVTVCTTLSGTSDIYNAVRLSTISDTAGTMQWNLQIMGMLGPRF